MQTSEREKPEVQTPAPPRGGSSASRNFCQASCPPPPPSHPLTAFPPPYSLGPQAGSLTQLTGVCRRLRSPPPPPSRPSAGREPACLSRPIYHQHGNNPRESAGPRPGPPARTAPDGQNPGSVTATAGWRGKPPGSSRPERPARVLPGPGPSSSRQAGCRAAGTARRAGQSYFYLV